MNFVVLLLAFALFWKPSNSIKCYKCEPDQTNPAHKWQSCDYFDGEEKFTVDCSSSTMCFKRTITLDLGNGMTTKSEERGCAQQTLSGDQRKIDGKWELVHDIYEVYDNKCTEQVNDYVRTTKTLDCYCRGDFCNSAERRQLNIQILTFIILVFLAYR